MTEREYQEVIEGQKRWEEGVRSEQGMSTKKFQRAHEEIQDVLDAWPGEAHATAAYIAVYEARTAIEKAQALCAPTSAVSPERGIP